MEVICTERRYTVNHNRAVGRSAEENSKIEFFPDHIDSKAILYARLTSEFGYHHFVILSNHPVTVDIAILDIARHRITSQRSLGGGIQNVLFVTEKSFGNVAVSG